jgi:hypothetical protein
MANGKDYSAQGELVVRRKERDIEKAKDALAAMKSQIHKLHKAMLKDEEIKSSVSQEMINGVKGGSPLAGILAKLKGRTSADQGLNSADLEEFGNVDNCPTGLEDRYWEREE